MKNFSQKMAETALLLSSFPNVIPIFIKGKFKLLSALLSTRIYHFTITLFISIIITMFIKECMNLVFKKTE